MDCRRHARFGKGDRTGARCARGCEIEDAAGQMLHGFADTDDLHKRSLQLFGDLRANKDNRATAVADDTAIEPVQWIGDQWRVEYVLDRDHLRQHGVRIVLGMMRSRDLDPGELRAGGAVIVHVPHGAHGVAVRRRDGVRHFPAGFRLVRIAGARRRAGRHAFGARPPGQGDQRDRALAERDRFGGVADLQQV